jgi:aminoglycoside/choline kinase family phosphotransferase
MQAQPGQTPSAPPGPDAATPRPETGGDARRDLLLAWLEQLPAGLGLQPGTLRPASSDASFRRYFRVDCAPTEPDAGPRTAPGAAQAAAPARTGSMIVMDAPPAHEDCRPFVRIARLLAGRGVNTPRIVESDLAQGLLLLTDFGDTTYADALRRPGVDAARLYADALATLVRLQQELPGTPRAGDALPAYDAPRLLAEMRLFPEWYVARHLGVTLSASEHEALEGAFARLAEAAQAQAQVLVHRDYHCRNLMWIAPAADTGGAVAANPGVLDFQDAVAGPITYDLVSLLRDAYVEWPEEQQIDWAARYWESARAAGLRVPERFDVFWRDLEWMSLQRSLKVLGIFARLCHRDGKPRYLSDLPVVLRHAQRVVERYDAFAALARLFDRVHGRAPVTGFTF